MHYYNMGTEVERYLPALLPPEHFLYKYVLRSISIAAFRRSELADLKLAPAKLFHCVQIVWGSFCELYNLRMDERVPSNRRLN